MTSGSPDLEAKRAFLRQPAAHPEAPVAVQVIETHFALVFVTDAVVRKLKKPLRNEWLDFSTLERRCKAAEAEVAMNRPLAPGVYQGTEPLVVGQSGELAIGRPGRLVDVLVKMRRLPAMRALDRAAAYLQPADLEPVIDHLAAHYAAATLKAADPDARLEQIRSSLENLHCRIASGPLRERGSAIHRLLHFAQRSEDALRRRVHEGRIVDAHGDLRPEHVYLTAPPAVIDRLEFGPALRRIDWLEDVALLAVDLERQGRAWIGHRLMTAIAARLGDRPPAELWCFYRGWRALLRAQLAVEHLDRPDHRRRAHWLRRARSYLAVADRHAATLTPRSGLGLRCELNLRENR